MIRVSCAMLLVVVLAAGQADEQMLMVNVDLVNIYFTVCNKKGRPIGNLARENFSIFEDENRQVITNFSRETDVPLTIVLLIDTSGSVRYKLSFEQDAATQFLYSSLRPGRDKAAMFTFETTVDLRQDYTDDAQLLVNAVRKTRAGGGTRLYDALYFILNKTFAGREGRRGIILLTDGEDNSSRRSPQEVVEAAQRNNVAIYAISVNSFGTPVNEAARSDGVLEMFAAETGGTAFFPTGPKELSAYFQMISNELRSQYTVAYRSTNEKRDGSFRKVRIDVKHAHYSVHSRSGYYAPIGGTAGGTE
jgi:Ca-activated chloride channel homolog